MLVLIFPRLDKFEDTKGVIISHKYKDRQHKAQKKKDKNKHR